MSNVTDKIEKETFLTQSKIMYVMQKAGECMQTKKLEECLEEGSTLLNQVHNDMSRFLERL